MKKALIYITVILVLGSALFYTVVRYTSFSEGYRAGVIMKMSRKGVIFKTFEGQMNMGGVQSGSEGDLSTVWNFSVNRNDQEVLDGIEEAVDNGYRVKLYYEEKYMQLDMFGDTEYFITKVEKVGNGMSSPSQVQ